MKKTAIVLAFVSALVTTKALAQDDSQKKEGERKFDPTEMIQKHTERMAEQYGLDEKQTEKLLELNKEYAGKMRPMGRPPRMKPPKEGENEQMAPPTEQERPSKEQMDEMRKKMEEDRNAYNAKLKEIMTDEQYAKFEQEQKAHRDRRPPMREEKKDE